MAGVAEEEPGQVEPAFFFTKKNIIYLASLLPPGQGRGPGRHQAGEVASEEPGQVEPALVRPRAALNRAEVSYGSKKGKREGP